MAVIERQMNPGHIGLGYITGPGLREGAIASSVSHDSHDLIVVGAEEESMAAAANCVWQMGGQNALKMARLNRDVRQAAALPGFVPWIGLFMNPAFVGLPMITRLEDNAPWSGGCQRKKLIPFFCSDADDVE